MKTLLLLLAGLLLAHFPACAQWALQPFLFTNSLPASAPCVSALSVVNAKTVWAIAASQSYSGSTFYSVGDNEVARTVNGGTTWTVSVASTMPFANESFTNITGLSASTALACSARRTSAGVPSGGGIWKTVDGGSTWTAHTTPAQLADTSSYPTVIFAFRMAEALCVGNPTRNAGYCFELYRSADSGDTWVRSRLAAMPQALPGEVSAPFSAAQVGDHIWFGTSVGRVFHSPDRGQTWTVSSTGLVDTPAISFRDASHGLATVLGTVASTTDGGATWQHLPPGGPVHQLLATVPGTNDYLSAGQGTDAGTSISHDEGHSWIALETTRSHFALAVHSATVAWSGAVDCATTSRAGLGAYRFGSITLPITPPLTGVAAPAFTVFPNPSLGGQLTLNLLDALPAAGSLLVFDALGRCVATHPLPTGSRSVGLSLGHVAPGCYLMQLRAGAHLAQQRVVVQ